MKENLGELLQVYPMLNLLTGDAISVLRLWTDSETILQAKNEKVQWNPANAINIPGF